MASLELGTRQCGLRLRRLQALVASAGVDGLLLVTGVDGKYSVGCSQALAYLLQGASNREAAEAVHLAEDLSDCVLLVTRSELVAYVPRAETAAQIYDLLAESTPGVTVLVPTPEEAADPDAVEETKLGAFVALLRGKKLLAMPWVVHNDSTPSTPPSTMQLEQWPLLQALGLEGVTDVCAQLQDTVYSHLDGHAVERAMGESAATLQQHWFEMIRAVGSKAPGPAAAALTERQVLEPLISYFSYGLLRPAHGVAQAVATMPPKVLAGARTNDDAAASEPLALSDAPGPSPGAPPLHFVAEAADGRGPLRCARTYFLSQAALTRNPFADVEEEAEEGYSFDASTAGWAAGDALLLMRTYASVVAASKAAMAHFATADGADATSARGVAMRALEGVLDSGADARFALWECDHVNRVSSPAVRGSRKLKVPAHAGAPPQLLNLTERLPPLVAFPVLGVEGAAAARAKASFARLAAASPESALASDATALAAAAGARAARRTRLAKRATVQADCAAAKLRAAAVSSEEEGGIELPKEVAEEEEEEEDVDDDASWAKGDPLLAAAPLLGRMLTFGGGEPALLLTGAPTVPALPGTLWCFSAGLVFVADGSGALSVLPFYGRLEAMTLQTLRGSSPDGSDSLGEAVVLRGCGPACGLAPACHVTTNTHLAIPLAGMTATGRRHILSDVLPVWQQACADSGAPSELRTPGIAELPLGAPQISYLKDADLDNPLPAECHRAGVAAVHRAHGGGSKRWPAMDEADGSVEAAVARLDAMELAAGLAPLDPSLEALLPGNGTGVPISLVLGAPSADVPSVCCAVATCLGERDTRAAVALIEGAAVAISPAAINAALNAALSGGGAGRPAHVVLGAITSHGAVALLRCLAASKAISSGAARLVGIVSCVSAEALYEEPARGVLMPGLLAQLAPGYVDAVVLSAGGAKASDISHANALLASAAGGAPVLRGSRPALVRARDELLPGTAERRARLAASAGLRRWGAGADGGLPQLSSGPIQAVLLTWVGELDVASLRSALATVGLPAAKADTLELSEEVAAKGQRLMVAAAVYVDGMTGGAPAELLATRAYGLRRRDWGLAGVTLAAGGPKLPPGGVPGGQLLLMGSGLAPEALCTLLQSAGTGAGAPTVPPRTRDSLTQDERSAIAAAKRLSALPAGCCFDGSVYRDDFGDVIKEHPSMGVFIGEFMAKENERITAENAAVAEQAARALAVTAVQQWL
ncbi:hypothetical protein FOA52_000028 [Chlamydomonas sp. UWO 241]|nr:hypothetical protein FOA52_000028 [Chlamydomonas sp. UWO 241]